VADRVPILRLGVVEHARQHEVRGFEDRLRMFRQRIGRRVEVVQRSVLLDAVIIPCETAEKQAGQQDGKYLQWPSATPSEGADPFRPTSHDTPSREPVGAPVSVGALDRMETENGN